MRKMTNRLDWGVFLLFIALFGGCQTVAYTGRSQLDLISESEEKKMGVDAYEDTLKKTPLSKNQAWQAQLKRVGQKISAAAAKPGYQWDFNVLQGKEVNAFCHEAGGDARAAVVSLIYCQELTHPPFRIAGKRERV